MTALLRAVQLACSLLVAVIAAAALGLGWWIWREYVRWARGPRRR